MSDILTGYILSFACAFGAIGLISLLRKPLKLGNEISRKLIHILVGFTWLPMYFYLKETVHIIIVPVIFIAVNYASLKFTIFKAMEREKNQEGKSDMGTVYFAVSMSILSVISYFYKTSLIPYGISVFCLSFGDGAAAIAGTWLKDRTPTLIEGKSLAGTLACFIFAIAGVYFACFVTGICIPLWKTLLLAFLTAVFEMIGKQFDNFTIPLGITATCLLIL